MLKIKLAVRITNDEVFQRKKEEKLVLKIEKNGSHSRIGHIIKNNEFAVNIIEGAKSGRKKVSRQKHRS